MPLLGINRGRLGFLTDVSPNSMLEDVDTVLDGRYSEDRRSLLAARLERRGAGPLSALALNDVVVNKWETGRTMDFETSINGRFVNSHGGDGMVIATATGSTAYALSCGGPIVEPDLDVWVLAPICPHTLSDRPIVVRAGSKIQLRMSDRFEARAQVTCDGTALGDLEQGDDLYVEAADAQITLLHPPGYDYYRLLRSKLHWGRGAYGAADRQPRQRLDRMLTHLQLRDLVLVDQAELELKSGLTALTGETGAGKSIVVDALLLIAGGRAGGDIVRQGAERAEVAAGFTALPPAARAWLDAQAIEHDGELVVRRVIGADGRSRAYVNGQLVPLQALRELAELADRNAWPAGISASGEPRHAARDARRTLGGLRRARRACRSCIERYRDLQPRVRSRCKSAAADRDSRLDLLRYQLAELKAEVTTAADIEELVRRPEARCRPRPPGGGGAQRHDRCVRVGR